MQQKKTRGTSRDLSQKYEQLRAEYGQRHNESHVEARPGKSAIEKAADLTLEYKDNLENGVKQFVRLNGQMQRMLERQSSKKDEDEDDDSSENDKIQVMKETLTQIESNFQKDLRKLRALLPFVKGIEAKTPMKVHLRHNTQDMCTVWINHYHYMWKEILDMPDSEEEAGDGGGENAAGDSKNGPPKPKSVSDALLQLYFHLERCVDGSDVYMGKLSGLVKESQRAREYAAKCLDIVEKSRGERTSKNSAQFPTSKEKIATRRYRAERFYDETILEHLYNRDFLTFVHEFRSQILEDYKAVGSFTSDSSYRLFFRNDSMEVVFNTLQEIIPPFLEFLSHKQQKLTGNSKTFRDRVVTIIEKDRVIKLFKDSVKPK